MFTEQQLSDFTAPASLSEEQQCERATRMIREAVQEYSPLAGRSYEIIAQGSYPNNTNARRNSDVDICVVFDDVFIADFTYAPGLTLESLGTLPSDKIYSEDRDAVLAALRKKFGASAITPGNKAFDVHSVQGSRVDADVVPAWRFRGYRDSNGFASPPFHEGIVFWSQDGKRVVNFPEQHLINGRIKNTATSGYFKKAARILKHVRYEMLEEKVPAADGASSFLLECMLYNVPNLVFSSSQTWKGTMQNLLHHMFVDLRDGQAEKWMEVSGNKWLFDYSYGIRANWSIEQARAFILAAYIRVVE